MKKILYIALAAAGLLAGCNKEIDDNNDTRGGAVEFTAGVQTRATGDAWELGDNVGVFAFDGATAVTNGDNEQYTITDITNGAMSAADGSKMYYPVGGTLSFYAYYPHSATAVSGTSYAVNAADQSTAPKTKALDLMWAKPENKSSGNVALQFTHRMAKLHFEITAGGLNVTNLTGMTAVLKGANATASFDLKAGTFSGETPGDIVLNVVVDADPTKATIDAFVVPTTDLSNVRLVLKDNNTGKEFGWRPTAEATWTSGQSYTYTLTAGKLAARVGDYYYKDGTYSAAFDHTKTCIGIVFWKDPADPTHGKIVSLNEAEEAAVWAWENIPTGAISDDDGLANMRAVKEKKPNFHNHPPFEYVNGLNPASTSYADGSTGVWYLPAKNELKQLYAAMSGLRWIASGTAGEGEIADWGGGEMPGNATYSAVREAFNDKFTADGVGGKEIGSVYWSSTEDGSNGAWYVYFGSGNAGDGYKSNLNYVRSCLAF